jgi:hypothetical protein
MSAVRVLLGIASAGTPAKPFIDALTRLELPEDAAPLERSVAVGNFIPAQRELIIGDAIDGDFDYLFFVDDDIVLPPKALKLLLQTAQADPQTAVVGGLYYTRDSIRPIAVANWTSSDTSTAHIPPYTTRSNGIVDGIGFGCALLRISAARALSAPYFPAHIFIERAARRVRLCDEDYLYCERIREAGFTVRLDARVRCGHYDRTSDSTFPLTWETDAETGHDRMIVIDAGVVKLVPLDESAPRVVEHHVRANVTYITVD